MTGFAEDVIFFSGEVIFLDWNYASLRYPFNSNF
jgi:hypothetical protein